MAVNCSPPLECVALTALRRPTGLSKKQLAKKTELSHFRLSQYETSLVPPSEVLAQILAAMGYDRRDYDKVVAALVEADALAAIRRGEMPQPAATPVDPTPDEWNDLRSNASEAARETERLALESFAEALCERKAAADRAEAERLCKRLEEEPKPWLVVEKVREVQTWAVAERLAHRSAEIAPEHAGRAVELAALAHRIAELAACTGPFRQSLLGHTRIHQENAARAAGDLPAAAALFAESEALWQAGAAAPGPLPAWRRHSLAGSLLRDQGRLAESLARLDAALETAPDDARGRLLVTRALTLERMGETEQAIELLEEAGQRVDRRKDPRLFFIARFNHASFLCRLGRFGQAELLVAEIQGMAAALGPGLHRARLRWLRGSVDAGVGRLEKAEAAFEAARRELTAHQAAWDCALVSVELAAVLCRNNRQRQLRELTRQMSWLFEDKRISGEAKAALQLVCDAVDRSSLTPELARLALKRLLNAPKADAVETPPEQPGRPSDLSTFSGAASAPFEPSPVLVDGSGGSNGAGAAAGVDDAAAVAVQGISAGGGLQDLGGRGPEGADPDGQTVQESGGPLGSGATGSEGG